MVAENQTCGRLETCVAVCVTSLKVLVAFSRVYVAPVCVWPSQVVVSRGSDGGGVPGTLSNSGMCPSVLRRPSRMASQIAGSRKLTGDPPKPWLIVS